MSSAPQKGVAPIREEFLAKKAAEPSSGAVDEDTGDSATNKRPAPDDDKGETEHPEKRRHRERGQNKHRKPYRPEAPKLKMCAAIVDGRPCPYGDGCRFSHDLAAYMQERPDDLGETCPIYTLRGHCRFGVRCRFGSCHLDATTGTNLRTEVTPAPEEEANTVSNDLINRLRKKHYDFARTDRIAQRFHDAVQSAHEQHQGKSAADAERAERGEATDSVPTSGADADAPPADAPPADAPSADAAGEAAANLPEPPLSATAYHALAAEEIMPPSHPKRKVDFRGKLYLAPLTTVGNLPFRRVCKRFGADITCGEMALATSLLQGAPSEWALLKRHPCEDVFGVQLAGNQPTAMGRVAQLIEENCDVDFVDINMGCPIDAICNKGMGSALSTRPGRVQSVVRTMSSVLSCPLTVKMRVGYEMAVEARFAHKLIPKLAAWGAQAVTLHGRSRQQRYTKQADWDYIHKCAHVAAEPRPRRGGGGGRGRGTAAAGVACRSSATATSSRLRRCRRRCTTAPSRRSCSRAVPSSSRGSSPRSRSGATGTSPRASASTSSRSSRASASNTGGPMTWASRACASSSSNGSPSCTVTSPSGSSSGCRAACRTGRRPLSAGATSRR